MQHDLIAPFVGACPASLPKLAASTDEIAGAKNRPHGPSPRPDAAALLRRIPGVNERPSRDPLEWCELLARSHQYRKSDRAVLTFLAILQNRQALSRMQSTGNGGRSIPGVFVLPSAVPIILVALLFFVLLSLGSLVLLSFALRYRAGTARRQGTALDCRV